MVDEFLPVCHEPDEEEGREDDAQDDPPSLYAECPCALRCHCGICPDEHAKSDNGCHVDA